MYNAFNGPHPEALPVIDEANLVKHFRESYASQVDLKQIIILACNQRKAAIQDKIDQLNKAKVRLIDSLAGEGTKLGAADISDQVRGMVADTNNLQSLIKEIDDSVNMVFAALGGLLEESTTEKSL